tara:strand:- start:1634 stop:1978 length:345 start_codon:yes stop_codon:yes gene_type:complete
MFFTTKKLTRVGFSATIPTHTQTQDRIMPLPTHTPPTLNPVLHGAEAFEETLGRTEIFEGDDGECELAIVNQVTCISPDAIQALFDAGFTQEANSLVLMQTALNARDHVVSSGE